MKKLLSLIAVLLAAKSFATPTVTPVGESYPRNQLEVRGNTPNLLFTDLDDAGNFKIIANGGVLKFDELQATSFFSVPFDASFGVEMPAPGSLMNTTVAGGSLAVGSHYFVVAGTDGSQFTNGSNEVLCTTTGGNQTCQLTWNFVPFSTTYRIFHGTSPGAEAFYKTFVCVGPVTCTFNYSTTAGEVAGTPNKISKAYSIHFFRNPSTGVGGVQFSDGTTETTASGASAWQVNGSDILNTNSGNVGIFDGSVFSPAGKLSLVVSGANDFLTIDSFGTGFSPKVIDRMSRGTFGAPTAAQSSDNLGGISARPRDNVGFSASDTAAIYFIARENQTTTAHGSRIDFYTTPTGSTTIDQTMTLSNLQLITFVNGGASNAEFRSTNDAGGHVGAITIKRTFGGTPFAFMGEDSGGYAYLDAWNGVTADKISINSLGGQTAIGGTTFDVSTILTVNGNMTVNGGSLVATNNITSFAGRILGGAMAKNCATSTATIISNTTTSPISPVSVTLGGAPQNVFVTAEVLGYVQDDTGSMDWNVSLLRDNTTTIDSGANPTDFKARAPDYASAGALTQRLHAPVGIPLMAFDAPTAGAHTYNVKIVSNTGFTASDFLDVIVTVCAHEIP